MKLISLVVMLAISASLFSQQPELTKEEYLKKSKSQKTAAWVLAGGGTALVVIGLVAYADAENPNNPFEIFDTSDLVFTLLGGAALVGSKILFKAAAKNKTRQRPYRLRMKGYKHCRRVAMPVSLYLPFAYQSPYKQYEWNCWDIYTLLPVASLIYPVANRLNKQES